MKKSLVSIYAMFAVIMMLSLSACEKENTNSASAIGKATIMGTVKARFDLTKIGSDSLTAVGGPTKLYAKYNSKDLVVNPSTTATYADIIKEVVLDGTGNYSFTVDANLKDVTVTLYADDFTHEEVFDLSTKMSMVYSLTPVKVTVTKDVVRIQDLKFKPTALNF